MTVTMDRFASQDLADKGIEAFLAEVEKRRIYIMSGLDEAAQAAEAQFFTPVRAAQLIASMFTLAERDEVRIFDPGAGTGSLTAALVARLLAEKAAKSIAIVVVEKDGAVVPALADYP